MFGLDNCWLIVFDLALTAFAGSVLVLTRAAGVDVIQQTHEPSQPKDGSPFMYTTLRSIAATVGAAALIVAAVPAASATPPPPAG